MQARQPDDQSEFVRETQIDPVAGVWACDNCGRRIQVITASDVAKVQSFICVCGTEMRPGEEHAVVDESIDRLVDNQVVDD
jgi:hypothetical protein